MERRLAAILAADVVGYSRLMEADEAGTLMRLKAHMSELVLPKISEHHGNLVKTTGDGALAEFRSVVEALVCAVEIQRAMKVRNESDPVDAPIRFRIGINIGDIVIDGGDIFGDGVNIAARLEGLAEPGGICVHRDVRNQVRGRVEVDFEDMGEVAVKNITKPLRAYRVNFDGHGVARKAVAPAPARRRPMASMLIAVAALVVLLAGAAALWPLREHLSLAWRGSEPQLPTDRPTVAVLPFGNTADDPEQQYLADGLTEDLTTELAGVSGLFIIAHSSMLAYKGASPRDVSAGLGVRYAVEGSVRKYGSRVRINASLTEADTSQQIWADQYDREMTDVFEVQDEVIAQIVRALSVELTDVELEQIARVPTENLEAYDYYLRAETEGYYKTDFQTAGRALEFYSKAIDLDPGFADAHAGYARTAVEVWRNGADQIMPEPVARKLAYEEAGKALELDPGNARAYTVLAILQLNDGRREEAIQSAEKSVVLRPNNAEAHANKGMVLSYLGRHDEAIEEIKLAELISPTATPGLKLLAGIIYYNAGDYERAADALDFVVAAWPDAEIPLLYLIATQAAQGETDLARETANGVLDIPQNNVAAYRTTYGDSYAHPEDAERFLDGLRAAGIPDWPFGFEGRPEDRVTGPELEALVAAGVWSGTTPLGSGNEGSFMMQIDQRLRVAYAGDNTLLTGEARIENDQVCVRFDSYLRGRWTCGDVFRNAPGAEGSAGDYVYVLPDGLRYFSVSS